MDTPKLAQKREMLAPKNFGYELHELHNSAYTHWISLHGDDAEVVKEASDCFAPRTEAHHTRTQKLSDDNCLCSEIDIHRIFDEGGPEIEICNLKHAMQCLRCPLCRVISELAEKYPEDCFREGIDYIYGFQYWSCRLKRAVATQDEFPQRMSTVPFARLLLILRPDPRSSFGPNLFTLDRIGVGPLYHPDSQRSCLYRRAIRAAFDPNLLREWLVASDKNEAYTNQAQFTQQIASFKQILSTGKFRVVDVAYDTIITVTEHVRFLALSYVWAPQTIDQSTSSSKLMPGAIAIGPKEPTVLPSSPPRVPEPFVTTVVHENLQICKMPLLADESNLSYVKQHESK
jgi:hypothetical protein